MDLIPLKTRPIDYLQPNKKYCLLLIEQTENSAKTYEFLPLACRIITIDKRIYYESMIPEINTLFLNLPNMARLVALVLKEYKNVKSRLNKIEEEKNKNGIVFSNRIAMHFYGDKIMAKKIIKALNRT